MDFLKKNWLWVAIALVLLLLVMRRRSGQESMLYASTGTIVPGTDQPASAGDGLTYPDASTTGPAQASRSGRGHF
jgi:hypothetical protein